MYLMVTRKGIGNKIKNNLRVDSVRNVMFYLFFISHHSPKHVLQHTFQPFRGPFLYVLTYLLH